MVIDTSAIVAILFGEPEAERFAEAIEQDPTRLMSAASVLETAIVVESELGEAGARDLVSCSTRRSSRSPPSPRTTSPRPGMPFACSAKAGTLRA